MKTRYSSWSLLAVLAACSAVDVGTEGASDPDLGVSREAAVGCVTPVSNLVVTVNTILCPGNYGIGDPEQDGVIKVTGNNVELVITGVTLTGTGTGYGIKATSVNGATIRSATTNRGRIRNFRSAILIEGGASHRVLENVLSNNIKKPINQGNDFLQVWEEWEQQIALGQVGNGVVLRNVASATLTNNQARFQQNGISLFDSTNVTMTGNDCSDNQGWGIQLHRSSNNTVRNNRADNVNLDASTTCVQDQQGACDTAGILVIKGANDNLIQNNSFKNGGDGIFSAALGPPGFTQYGADHNRYIGNDVSFAKHLGIEATFADGVTVENNTVLNVGRSGVWLGGSKNSIIRNNTITGSGWSGIENEGARNITVENNRITGSVQNGINLRNLTGNVARLSTDYLIVRNTIQNNGEYAIRAEDTHAMNATQNVMSNNGLGSVHIELRDEPSLTGPINVNESQLLDANKPCGGVDVECGCRVFDGNVTACDQTPGCAFYFCSGRCESEGTSECDAGCPGTCTGSCRDHDGHVETCDAQPGCAYYFCSNRCYPGGTPLSEACPCRDFDGNQSACDANPLCDFAACSGQCHFEGTTDCFAGCPGACGTGDVDCPIQNVTNITSNWWGTTNPAVIDAAICGANLNFVPFKTSP